MFRRNVFLPHAFLLSLHISYITNESECVFTSVAISEGLVLPLALCARSRQEEIPTCTYTHAFMYLLAPVNGGGMHGGGTS
jgi:hypothetical protein